MRPIIFPHIFLPGGETELALARGSAVGVGKLTRHAAGNVEVLAGGNVPVCLDRPAVTDLLHIFAVKRHIPFERNAFARLIYHIRESYCCDARIVQPEREPADARKVARDARRIDKAGVFPLSDSRREEEHALRPAEGDAQRSLIKCRLIRFGKFDAAVFRADKLQIYAVCLPIQAALHLVDRAARVAHAIARAREGVEPDDCVARAACRIV